MNVKALQRLPGPSATLLTAVALAVALPCAAQTLPSKPIVLGGGRITIGGDASATYSCADSNQQGEKTCADDPGFFNYTDYEHSALRMLRFDVTVAVEANTHLSFLAELRSENIGSVQPYGLYARIRPWRGRAFDIQV